jgi:hypothetical protein
LDDFTYGEIFSAGAVRIFPYRLRVFSKLRDTSFYIATLAMALLSVVPNADFSYLLV